jgi:hypothetical protein
MRRGSKPAKAGVEAKLPVARKSRENERSRVGDLENRLAESLKRPPFDDFSARGFAVVDIWLSRVPRGGGSVVLWRQSSRSVPAQCRLR